jgi:hypothetical protein
MKSSFTIAASIVGVLVQASAWAVTPPQAAESVSTEEVPASSTDAQLPTTSPPAQTQQPPGAQKALSTIAVVANPVALLFNMFNVDVGFAVADKVSANVSANYWSFSILGIRNTAWGLGFGGQYFFYRDRFEGAFVYPALEYAQSRVSIGDFAVSGSLFGPSAIVGYQWNWHPFTVRVGGGGRYYFGHIGDDGVRSDLEGFEFKADGSIGLAF